MWMNSERTYSRGIRGHKTCPHKSALDRRHSARYQGKARIGAWTPHSGGRGIHTSLSLGTGRRIHQRTPPSHNCRPPDTHDRCSYPDRNMLDRRLLGSQPSPGTGRTGWMPSWSGLERGTLRCRLRTAPSSGPYRSCILHPHRFESRHTLHPSGTRCTSTSLHCMPLST